MFYNVKWGTHKPAPQLSSGCCATHLFELERVASLNSQRQMRSGSDALSLALRDLNSVNQRIEARLKAGYYKEEE